MVFKRIALSLFILSSHGAFAQVIPDLTTGDHFRPYMTEAQKQEEIAKSFQEYLKKKYPNTSEELYPHLYKYTNQDYLAPIRGTTADQANAFTDYSKINYMKPTGNLPSGLPQSSFNNSLSVQQRNMAVIEADMAAYEAQKKYSQQLVQEAIAELEKWEIKYTLGTHNGAKVEPFVKAYSELTAMMNGTQKIDFLKATWLVESAVDPSLSWDEFNGMFQSAVQIISQLMVQEKVNPNDNLSKIMYIYKYMADTTSVFMPGQEKTVVTKPMLYDFEDFKAEKDLTKVFVSKLLRTGSGQCMSLPMLYYLFAKAFRAEAYLAFAPKHSYIKFKDNLGNWQNIELTGRIFASDDVHWSMGFIKGEQVKSGIYMTPVSEKETIAYLLTTLTLSYVKTFGTDDRALEMALTAKEHFPKSLTASMIVTGYSHELWKHVQRQYAVLGLSDSALVKDEKAQAIKLNREKAINYLKKDLGYDEIPDWAYKQWLDGVNEMAKQRQSIVRRRQLEQQLRK